MSSSSAESLKELGNEAYAAKDYDKAIDYFSQAIALEENAKFFLNRSLSYAAKKEWKASAVDARKAIQLDGKYGKAHCRLVKALMEMSRLRDARIALLLAFKECGESADLKALEKQIIDLTGIPLRPRSTDFEVLHELGEGNFSKVYEVEHKVTKMHFAIKTIEKVTVDRMKRRHPNIHNEILMEKRALQKLDHPGIITLYGTFQDAGTLYYQMEYIDGHDLWTALHYPIQPQLGPQVGLHWSLLRPIFAEILSAVEHMHQHGIVHRDIKPENILLTPHGHIKFIDYGTAKDLIEKDLNGPSDFVGTAEYMSPSSIQRQKGEGELGIDVDLWALGVLLYQLTLGFTPFQAASPYLTFLRTRRGRVVLPLWIPNSIRQLIRLFLTLDRIERIRGLTNLQSEDHLEEMKTVTVNYDKIRGMPFFQEWREEVDQNRSAYYYQLLRGTKPGERNTAALAVSSSTNSPLSISLCKDGYSTVEQVRAVFSPTITENAIIPSLHDLCLRAVGEAAVALALATSRAGGVRPRDQPWMTAFHPLALYPQDIQRIAHFLSRRQQFAGNPAVFRLFYHSLPDARCLRASLDDRQYLGLDREVQQNNWSDSFHIVQIAQPHQLLVREEAGQKTILQTDNLRSFVTKMNRLRPQLVVTMGPFISSSLGETGHEEELVAVRNTLSRLSDTIPLLFVPSPRDLGVSWGDIQCGEGGSIIGGGIQLANYRHLFGADYYGFWCRGLRGLVVNSSLLIYPELAPLEAKEQELWLEEEIEQAKLCANVLVLFSYHPFFLDHADEEDKTFVDEKSGKTVALTVPRAVRKVWLQRLRHHKVHFLVSAMSDPTALLEPAEPATAALDGGSEAVRSHKAKRRRPFPKSKSVSRKEEEEASLAQSQSVEREESNGDPTLPTPPTIHIDDISPVVSGGDADDSPAGASSGVKGSESGENSEEEDAKEKEEEEEETFFANEEDDYEGPEQLFSPLGSLESSSAATGQWLRVMRIKEEEAVQKIFWSDSVPANPIDLAKSFD
eukprot:gene2033-2216_t